MYNDQTNYDVTTRDLSSSNRNAIKLTTSSKDRMSLRPSLVHTLKIGNSASSRHDAIHHNLHNAIQSHYSAA